EALGRESTGIERERPLDDETHHLPVAGRGVLAGGELHRLAAGAGRPPAPDEREKPQLLEVRERRRMPFEHVSERVGPGVPVRFRVRSGTDTQAVADDNDDPTTHTERKA